MLAFYLSLLETDEDRALFEFYFHQHEQSVLKIVMKLLRNQAMAEDAVQNGWVNLIKNFEKFVQLSMQERDGYIVSIMKNAARDVLRQETRFVGLEDWNEPIRFEPVSAELEQEALIQLIRQLPDPYCSLLERSAVLNMSNREIAKQEHVSEATISRRLDRARAMLRAHMKKEGFDF